MSLTVADFITALLKFCRGKIGKIKGKFVNKKQASDYFLNNVFLFLKINKLLKPKLSGETVTTRKSGRH